MPTPLGALLRQIGAQFESLAAQRGGALLGPAELPSDSLHALPNADKVEAVLANLLTNALNHTSAGGTVHVRAALPELGSDYYAVTAANTDAGIAPSEQARGFERSY